jgi:hypothetical protein
MTNQLITAASLFPDICKVALDQAPEFLIRVFDVKKDTKPGELSQHKLWKKLRTSIKTLLKGK